MCASGGEAEVRCVGNSQVRLCENDVVLAREGRERGRGVAHAVRVPTNLREVSFKLISAPAAEDHGSFRTSEIHDKSRSVHFTCRVQNLPFLSI